MTNTLGEANLLRLNGCRTEPLGSYLQGLGAWRVLTRIGEGDVRACWRAGRLVLRTSLTDESLVDLILERFAPLPLVSPWNAGSGFAGNGKSKDAEVTLSRIEGLVDSRFHDLQQAIFVARRIVDHARDQGWAGTGTSFWDPARKADVIQLCRNWLPDDSVRWIDAAAALTQDFSGERDVTFSRVLGTGGNFGRQDLQATYLGHALTVLAEPKNLTRSRGWLVDALQGSESEPYLRKTVGQFDPGRAGGIQSSPAEEADKEGFANPWSFLFAIEGALFFAGAATRRLGSTSAGSTSIPFLVASSPVGYSSTASNENTMAELWAPQWEAPASVKEIEHLFAEGRTDWKGSSARNGLDLARALATRGVDQGIARFSRSVIAERLGQSPLAVPVGTVEVSERLGVALTSGLDSWLSPLRRGSDKLPQAVREALRRLDNALFDASTRNRTGLADVLRATGRLHTIVARSGRLRDLSSRPLRLAAPGDWFKALAAAEALQPESRLAAVLAGGTDGGHVPALRTVLTPVTLSDRKILQWSGRPPLVSEGDVYQRLATAHRRRAFDLLDRRDVSASNPDWPVPAVKGALTSFATAPQADVADVVRLLEGPFDMTAFEEFLDGWLLFDWTNNDRLAVTHTVRGDSEALLPSELALTLPFFSTRPLAARFREADPSDKQILLRPNRSWPAQLVAGRLDLVLSDATRRLQIAGARNVIEPTHLILDAQLRAPRLATALLLHVSRAARSQALRRACSLWTSRDMKDLDPQDEKMDLDATQGVLA